MRASSPGSHRGVWALALVSVCGLAACYESEPVPQKVERVSPFERGDAKRPPRDPNTPLRNPATEAPRGPDGEQVSAGEIEAALAEAAKQGEIGNTVAQRNALRACANKTPPNARCDAEMGLAQIGARNRKAAALYYLAAAANNDDPEVGADLYARVGEALRKHGKNEDAVAALRLAIARDENAEHLFLLGQTLSLRSETLIEAVETIGAARAKDDRLEWTYEQAVLSGQIPIREQAAAAAALFEHYLEQAEAAGPNAKLPGKIEAVELRAKELVDLAKQYPTQAEYDASRPPAEAEDEAAKDEAAKDDAAGPQ